MNDKQYYLDIFKVSEGQLKTLTDTALSHGGDFCDLYFEHTTFFNLLLKDGVVSSGGFHTDFGVGIRVLKGEKTGYAYSENTEMGDMLQAAKAASAIALGTSGSRKYMPVADRRHDLYPVERNWRDCSAASFLPFLKDLEKEIFSKDSRIVKVIARMSDSVSDVMMYNSLGELTCDTRPMGSVTATAVFQQDGKAENKTASRSFRIGAEFIGRELVKELAEEVVRGIDERFEATRPKGGQMPVVMGAGASGILLHEAMGHAFEADFNRKGQSIPDMIHEEVAEYVEQNLHTLIAKLKEDGYTDEAIRKGQAIYIYYYLGQIGWDYSTLYTREIDQVQKIVDKDGNFLFAEGQWQKVYANYGKR